MLVDRLRLSNSFFLCCLTCMMLIKLRKYKRMHVYHARARSSKRTRIYGLVRTGGRVYEIKTLRSNLAAEGGRGLFEGGIIKQVRYNNTSDIPCVVQVMYNNIPFVIQVVYL